MDYTDLLLIEKLISVKEHFMNELVKCHKQNELSSTELTIIYMLKHKKNRQKVGDLASLLFLPMSTLTGILDKMEKKLIIARERSNEDRRAVYVVLTSEFEASSKDFLHEVSKMMGEIKEEISKETLDSLYKTLIELDQVLKKRKEISNEG